MTARSRLCEPSSVVAALVSVLLCWPARARAEPVPGPPPAQDPAPIVEPLAPLTEEEPGSAAESIEQPTEEPGYISMPPEPEERDKKAQKKPEAPEEPEATSSPGRVRGLTQAGSATAILGGLAFGFAAWLTAVDDQRRLQCYDRRSDYTGAQLVECDPGVAAPRVASRMLYLGSVGLLAGSGSLWGKRAAEGQMGYGWAAPNNVAMGAAGGTLLGIGLVGWAVSRVIVFVSPARDACATEGFEECTRHNMIASDVSRGASVAMAGIGAAMLGYVLGYRAWMRRWTPKARQAFVSLALGRSGFGLVASGRF